MRRVFGGLAVVGVCLGGVGFAHAQGAAVEGDATVTVDPNGQPSVQAQGQVTTQAPPANYQYQQQQAPPPGYGQQPYPQQQYAQPYPQQQYPQPYYAPPVQPAQPRYVERTESTPALWVTGVVLLPVSWVLTWSATTATLDGYRDGAYWGWSWVPLVGPWFMIGDSYGLNGSEIAGAVLSGIAQLSGLTLIILGVAIRQTVRVATYALDDSERAPELTLGVAPTYGGGMLTAQITTF